ncbi:MAG TPA: LLM class F420-dependent oxidoreductase [Dehalococcoidia bacterium]|jgi:probable F420-dependent oxidoreductase|nr:LLM class F420-dependent oxidoreductase [Dehalococcoidia bacterium]
MKFGVSMFMTDYALYPDILAKEAEARGFESLWFPEHTHIPASRKSAYPGGGELPQQYYHSLDPFVALTAAATVTEKIKLGTGIALVIERDPITLAKEVASIDYVSNGRFLFGIGGGWNREEMENHGTDPSRRWKLLRERIEAMVEIWTKDEAEYHGEFVDFDPIWSWPKPVQKPYPPIMLGNAGPGAISRAVRFADEWMPIGARLDLAERISELNDKAEAAGRGPIPVTNWGTAPNREAIDELADIGVGRAIFGLPSAKEDEVIPLLDRYAELIAPLI